MLIEHMFATLIVMTYKGSGTPRVGHCVTYLGMIARSMGMLTD